MKKKNGFTLIELLAVIVILAVIALIAVPRIIEILNKSRISAAEDSTIGIVEAAESYVADFMLQNHGEIPENLEFECNSTGCNLKTTLNGYNTENLTSLEFKGKKPTSGTITVSDSGNTVEAEDLIISGYTCNYKDDKATCNTETTENNPQEDETQSSPLEWFTYSDNDDGTATLTGFSSTFETEYKANTEGTRDIILPTKTSNGKNITGIGYYAFSKDCLCEPDCPSSCYSMPDYFDRIVIPKEIVNLANYSIFVYSTEMTIDTLIIEGNVEAHSYAIKDVNINNLIFGDYVTNIPDGLISSWSGAPTIVIGKNVETIERSAFSALAFNPTSPLLNKIINKSGREFDWGSIIGNRENCNFVTGVCDKVTITSE